MSLIISFHSFLIFYHKSSNYFIHIYSHLTLPPRTPSISFLCTDSLPNQKSSSPKLSRFSTTSFPQTFHIFPFCVSGSDRQKRRGTMCHIPEWRRYRTLKSNGRSIFCVSLTSLRSGSRSFLRTSFRQRTFWKNSRISWKKKWRHELRRSTPSSTPHFKRDYLQSMRSCSVPRNWIEWRPRGRLLSVKLGQPRCHTHPVPLHPPPPSLPPPPLSLPAGHRPHNHLCSIHRLLFRDGIADLEDV